MLDVITDHIAKLREIEKSISGNDGASIRSRWEFGHYMLGLKKGKQLPNGTIAQFAREVNRHPSELSSWMKFAAKYPTEQQLSDVIRDFRNWYRITHKALPDKPHESKPQKTATRRVIKLLEGFDAAELSDHEILNVKQTLLDVIAGINRQIESRRKEAVSVAA